MPSIISLSNLVFCNISRNKFTILDVDFEKMDKLQHLIACFNQISEVPESLLKSSLETLDLYGNKISSISLKTMNMNLRRFDVAGNQISSAKFAEFCYPPTSNDFAVHVERSPQILCDIVHY